MKDNNVIQTLFMNQHKNAMDNILHEKFPSRTSLKKCRELLKADELGYTDEEVLIIRDFMHCLAKMIHDYYMRCQQGLHQSKVFDSIHSEQIKELTDTKR